MKHQFGIALATTAIVVGLWNQDALAQSGDRFVPRGSIQGSLGDRRGESDHAPPRAFAPTGEMTPVRSSGVASLAGQILSAALEDASAGSVSGEPLSLAKMLQGVQSSLRRRELIENYWGLSLAIVAESFARDEREFLRNTVAAQGDDDLALAARLAMAEGRIRETRLRAVDAQHRLAILRDENFDAPLPLPSDLPVTSAYRTYYEELFVRNAAPMTTRLAARRLHETLPLMRDIVGARAASVGAAERWLERTASSWRAGQTSPIELRDAWQSLATERRALLDAIGKYNGQIADYALLAAEGDANHLRLVAMLSFNTLHPRQIGATEQRAIAEVPLPTERASEPAVVAPLGSRATSGEQTAPRPFQDGDPKMRSILVPSRQRVTGS